MRAKVSVPATTANLGPGFDVIGMALDLCNEVEMEEIPHGFVITVEGEGADVIVRNEQNLVYEAAQHIFRRAGYHPTGLRIHLKNAIPVTRGLGSSSAALVGGLVAANRLCGDPFDTDTLLQIATELEGHPDNVAPALLGGVVVSGKVRDQWRTLRVQPPAELETVVAIPDFLLETQTAREVVPQMISRDDAIFTSSHVGLMVLALMQKDLELFGAVMEDRLHQPYREELIPGMRRVIEKAEKYGAVGAALSGAGPTIIAFTNGRKRLVGEMMEVAFAEYGIACKVKHLSPRLQGCVVIEEQQIARIG